MRAGIALGSNLGDRLGQLKEARRRVLEIPQIGGPVRCSRVYETEPVDTEPGTSPFLNAVIEVEFQGLPSTLLDALHEIEAAMGRPSKRPRNASRPIDLDILYAGNLVLHNEEIMIPHPRLHLRKFVLQPLADIRPELILPGQERNVADLFQRVSDRALVALFAEDWAA